MTDQKKIEPSRKKNTENYSAENTASPMPPTALEKMSRAHRMLSECNRAMIRTTRESELLKKICQIIVEVGGYRLAWIGYAESDKNKSVKPVAQKGYDKGYLESLDFTWAKTPLGKGPTGTSIRTSKPAIVKNIVIDPSYGPWQSEATKRGFASSISLPLLKDEKAFGALNIYASEPDAFDKEEIKLLEELANDLAYGIVALRTRIEHQQAEDALRESEARFAGILDLAGDAIISIDDDQKIRLFNKGAERIFGYRAGEVMGKPLDILLPSRYEKSHRREVEQFGRTPEAARLMGDRKEIVGLRKNNTEFPAEASISKFIFKDRLVFTVMLRDLTRRKEAEKQLLESEERYRLFFTEDISGDFIATPDGRIMECNPAFATIFGFKSVEEARKTNLVKIFPAADSWKGLLTTLREQKKLVNFETEFRHISGKPVYILANIVGRYDNGNRLIDVKGYFFDITDRKKIENQLIQGQRLEAIGRLAGGVAHDFNNTLTAILGFSDLLKENPDDSQSNEMIVQEIENAAKSAIALNKQLLTFSRQQILQPKVLNLNLIIRKMKKMLKPIIGEQIEFKTILDEGLGFVKADPGQIEQIIMNLVVNARDAMPEGGKLTIETRNIALDENYVDQHISVDSGSYIILAVSDTGIGMDEKTTLQIFEPFFTTKKKGKGTGLGLSTVYGIVTQSNGYIWVYSEPSHGTTFKIYLPRVDEVERTEDEKQEQKKSFKGHETVLLVEDDDRVRKMIYFVLRSHGYNILQATNGNEALQVIRSYDDKIHLMLTDIVMPEMSGIDLAEKINTLHPEIDVLYMSGYTDNSIMHHHDLEPGVNFLEKPFSAQILSTKVREMLDMKK